MDFFAGSSTTAEAVMRRNSQDGEKRRFILVQLPETLDPSKKEQKAAFKFCSDSGVPSVVSEISKERIRKAIDAMHSEDVRDDIDLGFKVLKLSSSNIRIWNPDRTDIEESLLLHEDHLIEGRTEQDVLYELLLKRGGRPCCTY